VRMKEAAASNGQQFNNSMHKFHEPHGQIPCISTFK
jgi:hypothetical protein